MENIKSLEIVAKEKMGASTPEEVEALVKVLIKMLV